MKNTNSEVVKFDNVNFVDLEGIRYCLQCHSLKDVKAIIQNSSVVWIPRSYCFGSELERDKLTKDDFEDMFCRSFTINNVADYLESELEIFSIGLQKRIRRHCKLGRRIDFRTVSKEHMFATNGSTESLTNKVVELGVCGFKFDIPMITVNQYEEAINSGSHFFRSSLVTNLLNEDDFDLISRKALLATDENNSMSQYLLPPPTDPNSQRAL